MGYGAMTPGKEKKIKLNEEHSKNLWICCAFFVKFSQIIIIHYSGNILTKNKGLSIYPEA